MGLLSLHGTHSLASKSLHSSKLIVGPARWPGTTSSQANSSQGKNSKKSLGFATHSRNLKKEDYLPLTPLRSAVCSCWHGIYCASIRSQRTSTSAVLTEAHVSCYFLPHCCGGQANKLPWRDKLKPIIPLSTSTLPIKDPVMEDFCKHKRKEHLQCSVMHITPLTKWHLKACVISLKYWTRSLLTALFPLSSQALTNRTALKKGKVPPVCSKDFESPPRRAQECSKTSHAWAQARDSR